MNYNDIVTFRKDLLFDGAVQIGWFETNRDLANRAAEHYVFHGPAYHGAKQREKDGNGTFLVDTASFTLDLLQRISGNMADDPFTLAVAGYGTGKSHFGVMLSCLLADPHSPVAETILKNLKLADQEVGEKGAALISKMQSPYLIVALNGMKDFYLPGEIMKQILNRIEKAGYDGTPLKNLRPRFNLAIKFVESFYTAIKAEFDNSFDDNFGKEEIIKALNFQDDEIFKKVNHIYEKHMGSSVPAMGEEALHEFLTVARSNFCGPGKPFAGIVILFDEFGRYLEFSVQSPHIAGSGSLQQLFEAVQENADGIYFLGFIQYELKAYISRMAPELRDDLTRYVSRYDIVRKVRLSTNLETLIANLLEKKDYDELKRQVDSSPESPGEIHQQLKNWLPDIASHALWADKDLFEKVVVEGCWPLHPLSTWSLYRLSSIGKSLQQRSAFSFLIDVFEIYGNVEYKLGKLITPVELCTENMINEFLSSEEQGSLGATAHAYSSAIEKYQYEFTDNQVLILKAVLMASKIGFKVNSKDNVMEVLSSFSGLPMEKTKQGIEQLEKEFAVLEWNDTLNRFEIEGDSVPKKAFLADLSREANKIDYQARAEKFSGNFMKWTQINSLKTDFGLENDIATEEWHYNVLFSSISILKEQIDYAFRLWLSTIGVDEAKGQLIYCYVGRESNLETVKEKIKQTFKEVSNKHKIDLSIGAPIAISLLYDRNGDLGQKVAEQWVLTEEFTEEQKDRYKNFIPGREESLIQEMNHIFTRLREENHLFFATEQKVRGNRLGNTLKCLFDVVYPDRIPFPFDGFHTARGNAAKDAQQFTKDILMGRLDKDTMRALTAQQRNRAYTVFEQSWEIFGDDGLIRIKPKNAKVRAIIEYIEQSLPIMDAVNDYEDGLNLGQMMRTLCLPPYGCNNVSAGLLLALFIGKRKNEIAVTMNKNVVSPDKWLQEALKNRFFDLAILDKTFLIPIDEEEVSEWERFLEEWEEEPLYSRKVDLLFEAKKLEKKITRPHDLHYRYVVAEKAAIKALEKLDAFDEKYEAALKKIEKGKRSSDVGQSSWGGADLVELLQEIQKGKEYWDEKIFLDLENHINAEKEHIKKIFQSWVNRLTVKRAEDMGSFQHINFKVSQNLAKLGLNEEKKILEEQVDKIKSNIEHITKINNIKTNISDMVIKNKVTHITPVSVLNTWLKQAEGYKDILDAVEQNVLWREGIDEAIQSLQKFEKQVNEQILKHRERMTKVFDIQHIKDKKELVYWQQECNSLLLIYFGEERDVSDLEEVLQQLSLIESHIDKLENYALSDDEFLNVYDECIAETEEQFQEDVPPLDYEIIYPALKDIIKNKRHILAAEWLKQNVPDVEKISHLDASQAVTLRNNLLDRPRLLSEGQNSKVDLAIKTCNNRLDELEIEGLLVRYKELNTSKKRLFLEHALKIFEIENTEGFKYKLLD